MKASSSEGFLAGQPVGMDDSFNLGNGIAELNGTVIFEKKNLYKFTNFL